ncbi:MAG: hypothetical protein CSB49_01515 [Proteobacteria bacterium]|nr:MAG: hypothetical protein CSB49_01515 [Pseudomonadota bacterium]
METTKRQDEIVALMRTVLGDTYTHLLVRRVVTEDDIDSGETSVTCEVTDEISGDKSVIAGKGVGIVDAFFKGMISRFAEDYPSLKTIRFHSFDVCAQLDTKQAHAGTDSEGEVTLEVANSEDKVFVFKHASRSVTAAAIVATLHALEHFINGERAFVSLHHALKDAKARNRSDLVQEFTMKMATLVKNTSYSEVIDRINQDIG